jgi:hypothetical protein
LILSLPKDHEIIRRARFGGDEILPYLNPNVDSMGAQSGKGLCAMRLGKHADNVRIQVQ